jgi:chemotaxis protein methyltransferase CheR
MAACKIDDAQVYYILFAGDTKDSAREWAVMSSLITTGESYFFRDKGHFNVLKKVIFHELLLMVNKIVQ